MKKWTEGQKFFAVFDGMNDLVNYCRAAPQGKHFTSRDSHETDDSSWNGTAKYEDADVLALEGWQEGYEKIKAALPDIKVKPTAQNRKHNERIMVEGFVPCVPRAIEGHPESMFNAVQIPYKHKVINMVINVSASCSYSAEQLTRRGGFVARLIDEIEAKGFRINLWVAEGASNGDQTTCYMVRIKNSTEHLSLKRIVYPIGHPSMLRRHLFRVLESLDVSSGWNWGYGRPRDEPVTEYCKKNFDAYLFIPSINTVNVDSDYTTYMEKVFKLNDFKLA